MEQQYPNAFMEVSPILRMSIQAEKFSVHEAAAMFNKMNLVTKQHKILC